MAEVMKIALDARVRERVREGGRVHLPRKMWGNPQSGRDKGSKDANYVEG